MFVQEIVTRKNYLKSKLLDVASYIYKLETLPITKKGELYNLALTEKFKLLSKISSHKVLLDTLNKDTTLFVGTEELSVYDAVVILNNLAEKIKTYDGIISHSDLTSVDFFTLVKQRDNLFEEYILIYNAINSSDSITDWSPNKVKESEDL